MHVANTTHASVLGRRRTSASNSRPAKRLGLRVRSGVRARYGGCIGTSQQRTPSRQHPIELEKTMPAFRNQRRLHRRRGVLTLEWILLVTVIVLGVIGGLGLVRNATVAELKDLADAI